MELGKLNSYMQKNEIGPLSYTTDKYKLKMEERLECKTWNHNIPRRKQAVSFLILALAMVSGFDTRGKGNKSKNKLQVRLHQTKMFLHGKENYEHNEKVIPIEREKTCKSYI